MKFTFGLCRLMMGAGSQHTGKDCKMPSIESVNLYIEARDSNGLLIQKHEICISASS